MKTQLGKKITGLTRRIALQVLLATFSGGFIVGVLTAIKMGGLA